MSKKVKIFIVVIVVIAIIIFAVSYFGNSAPAASATPGLSSSAAPATTAIPGGPASDPAAGDGANFSSLLSSINSITLDTSIFSDPAYKALVDNPVVLGTAIIGRVNPFAPIGSDADNGPAPVLQLQTLAPGKIISNSAEFGALVTVSNTLPTSVVFNYGTSDNFGSATAPVNVTNSGTALLTVTGLLPSTTYYVEAVAVQGSVTATGSIMSFTTTAPLQ
jgi:hypothetical protein